VPSLSIPQVPEHAVAQPQRTRANRGANRGAQRSDHEHYLSRTLLQIGPIVFSIAVISVLALAWIEREEGILTADSGLGYWLGIAGAVMMAMLALYPLRKRVKVLRNAGRVANWFRTHMILGILGPMLIVLHTNFKLGSLNSQLALYTMLVVVASGVAGRYLYARIHKGLYGQHVQIRDILTDLAELQERLDADLTGAHGIAEELKRHLPHPGAQASILRSALGALTIGPRAAFSRRRVAGLIRNHIQHSPQYAQLGWRQRRKVTGEIDRRVRVYFAAVRKAGRLGFFERLFGMWHHLHMPLFVVLAMTVVLHIIAVHRY
jgi:hypothetical protein